MVLVLVLFSKRMFGFSFSLFSFVWTQWSTLHTLTHTHIYYYENHRVDHEFLMFCLFSCIFFFFLRLAGRVGGWRLFCPFNFRHIFSLQIKELPHSKASVWLKLIYWRGDFERLDFPLFILSFIRKWVLCARHHNITMTIFETWYILNRFVMPQNLDVYVGFTEFDHKLLFFSFPFFFAVSIHKMKSLVAI